jgi:hypothetical protein
MKSVDVKKVSKVAGIVIAALLLGLSQLGYVPDLGISAAILKAVGVESPATAVAKEDAK